MYNRGANALLRQICVVRCAGHVFPLLLKDNEAARVRKVAKGVKRTRSPLWLRSIPLLLWSGTSVSGTMAQVTLLSILLGLSLQAMPAVPVDSCVNGTISSVAVHNHSIFSDADTASGRRLGWAYRAANSLHIRTQENVIRREVLFAEGDCFDPYRLTESERLLRAFNVLSRVSIRDAPQPDGSHRVTIDTQDEWSTRFDIRVSARGYGMRLGEENILGTGQSLDFIYIKHDVTREAGVAYFAPQLLGTRWDLHSEVGKSRAGTFVREEISYPWVGEFSRWASVQSFIREDRFFDYIGRDDPALNAPHVLLPLREKSFDLAVVRRYGTTGNAGMIGVAVGYQQLSYPGGLEIAPTGNFDEREPADSMTRSRITQQHATRDNIRVYALIGHRTVQWVERRGMDSMRGTEDVKLGSEIGLALGHSVPSLERDNDLYTTMSLYTGTEVGRALLIAKVRVDGRRSLDARIDAPEWEDFYGDGELLSYLRPWQGDHHLLFMRASAISAWNTRTPFQLTLGGEQAVRGFDRERFPGGRRIVFNAEDRMYFGWPYPKAFDLGATAFVDAGRIFPGDVPFGVDSGWRASVGAGLRSSFPAGSRTVYRVDFAWPLVKGTGVRDFRLLLSIGESLGMRPRSIDDQIARSRPQGAAGQLFPFAR